MKNERHNRDCDFFEFPPEGEITIHINNQPITIWNIRDISPFGIGLLLEKPLSTRCEVYLHSLNEVIDLESPWIGHLGHHC